jgi:hypothetical protein
MQIGPPCAISGCGGLGIYRCGACQRTYCPRHVAVVSGASAHGVEGPWRVRCAVCRQRLPLEPPWWVLPAAGEHEAADRGERELDDRLGGEEKDDATAG